MKRFCIVFFLTVSAGIDSRATGDAAAGADMIPPLPELLVTGDGTPVVSAEQWIALRRPEVLNLFREHVYGRVPPDSPRMRHRVKLFDSNALGGTAVQKEVEISAISGRDTLAMTVLIFLPADRPEPVPLFLGLNFYGNHTIHSDPGISLTESWVRNNESLGITGHRVTKASRGARSARWPVERIVGRGYGLATIYYGDIDPDYHDGFQNGIHGVFPGRGEVRDSSAWGSISAWAWGLSRALDYLETDPDADASRVAVIGHSRLGKTALWAGALDRRFAMVISNNSGCGGAALSRRARGERVSDINTSFPHWFASRFHSYNHNEAALPVDQHMLAALIAPRPLYVASAEEDDWADPLGEYLSIYHAGPVYRLFGNEVFTSDTLPPVDEPRWAGKLGYHMRSGSHDLTRYDWERYLDFADAHIGEYVDEGLENPVSRTWIRERLVPVTPRLILTPEMEERLRRQLDDGDGVATKGFQLLYAHAEGVMDRDVLRYDKRGRRLLGVSREALGRLTALALVYRIGRERRYLERLEEELRTVCGFPDWNPSHFLDVAEMAAGIALALDWAGEFLAPPVRRLARDALVEKALRPSLEPDHTYWVDLVNNWNLVCHGGLSLAALAVFEQEPGLAEEILHRAVEKIPLALAPYAPDGIYPEGPSYWFYATTYLAAAVSAFESALGTGFGFPDAPGVMESAEFSQVLAGPSGDYFNFFDAGLGGYHSLTHYGLLSWFARRSRDGVDRAGLEKLLDKSLEESPPERIPRFFSMHLLDMTGSRKSPSRGFVYPEAWTGRGEEPICVFRDPDNDPGAFFLAAKGGRAADNHGNMDAGSFIFEQGGVRWSVDPGNQGYHELEQLMGGELWNSSQESARWDLLTKNNFGHSTLTVNGERHIADARAHMVEFDLRHGTQEASFNLTPLFGGSVRRAIRTFSRTGADRLRISDSLKFSPETGTITWQLVTRAEIEPGNGKAVLQQEGRRMHVRLLTNASPETRVVALSPPPLPYDKEIPGLKRLEFEFDREDFPRGSGEVVVELTAN